MTPSQAFIVDSHQKEDVLRTSLSGNPGDFIMQYDYNIAEIIKILQLKFYQWQKEGRNYGGLEISVSETPVINFTGMIDHNAAYLTGTLIADDVLSISRENVKSFINKPLDDAMYELERFAAGDIAAFNVKRFLQKDSVLFRALYDTNNELADYAKRFTDRAVSTYETVQSELHDDAHRKVQFSITDEDLIAASKLTQAKLIMNLIHMPWMDMLYNDISMSTIRELVMIGNMEDEHSNMGEIPGFEGNVALYYDASGNIVSASTEAVTDSPDPLLPFPIKLTMNYDRKTQDIGIKNTVSAELKSIGAIILDVTWTENPTGELNDAIRLQYTDPEYEVDAGIQYKKTWTGTMESGSEKAVINAYYDQYYYDTHYATQKFKINSTTNVNTQQIDRNVQFYLTGSAKPDFALNLKTVRLPKTEIFTVLENVENGNISCPMFWDLSMWQRFMEQHADNVTDLIEKLSTNIPMQILEYLNLSE